MVNNFSGQGAGSSLAQSPSIMASSPASSPSTAPFLPHLSAAQYTRLLNLLDSSSPPQPSVPHLSASLSVPIEGNFSSQLSVLWIIDSGATDHVCCSLALFASYTSIPPVSVSLPTGSKTIAQFSGTVRISESLILYNVLFLPHFSFNILSVSRLTASHNCLITFSSTACQIHSTLPSLMIGSAKLFQGLYILTADMFPNHASPQVLSTNSTHLTNKAL